MCSHHGAGSRKREIEGVTKNPALARLTTGERAKPATLEQLWRDKPELRVLYDRHRHDDELLDMRPVLAQAKALAEWMVTRIDPVAADGEGGAAPVLKAIQALGSVMRAAREMLRIEDTSVRLRTLRWGG